MESPWAIRCHPFLVLKLHLVIGDVQLGISLLHYLVILFRFPLHVYVISKLLLRLVSTQPFKWPLILVVPGTMPSLFHPPLLLILPFQSPNLIHP